MTRNTAGIFGRVCSQKRVDRTGCPNSKVPPLKVQVFIQVENSKSNPQEKDVWIIWTKTNSKEHFWIWIKLCICIGTFLVEADAGRSKNSRHMRQILIYFFNTFQARSDKISKKIQSLFTWWETNSLKIFVQSGLIVNFIIGYEDLIIRREDISDRKEEWWFIGEEEIGRWWC